MYLGIYEVYGGRIGAYKWLIGAHRGCIEEYRGYIEGILRNSRAYGDILGLVAAFLGLLKHIWQTIKKSMAKILKTFFVTFYSYVHFAECTTTNH